jgi:hypothetical protein
MRPFVDRYVLTIGCFASPVRVIDMVVCKVSIVVRALCFVVMFSINAVMINFFVKGLHESGENVSASMQQQSPARALEPGELRAACSCSFGSINCGLLPGTFLFALPLALTERPLTNLSARRFFGGDGHQNDRGVLSVGTPAVQPDALSPASVAAPHRICPRVFAHRRYSASFSSTSRCP